MTKISCNILNAISGKLQPLEEPTGRKHSGTQKYRFVYEIIKDYIVMVYHRILEPIILNCREL